jgi:ATP-dependent DNA helicase RecG
MIPKHEDLYNEFKSTFNISIIETLVEFANSKEGTAYIGVNDKGVIKGVMFAQESVQQWVNDIKSKIDPSLVPYSKIPLVENKEVVF